jgi:hypothetical protein
MREHKRVCARSREAGGMAHSDQERIDQSSQHHDLLGGRMSHVQLAGRRSAWEVRFQIVVAG